MSIKWIWLQLFYIIVLVIVNDRHWAYTFHLLWGTVIQSQRDNYTYFMPIFNDHALGEWSIKVETKIVTCGTLKTNTHLNSANSTCDMESSRNQISFGSVRSLCCYNLWQVDSVAESFLWILKKIPVQVRHYLYYCYWQRNSILGQGDNFKAYNAAAMTTVQNVNTDMFSWCFAKCLLFANSSDCLLPSQHGANTEYSVDSGSWMRSSAVE